MPSDDLLRIRHILDAAEKAMAFVENKTRASLDEDEQLALSLVRLLEVVGEAARCLAGKSISATLSEAKGLGIQ